MSTTTLHRSPTQILLALGLAGCLVFDLSHREWSLGGGDAASVPIVRAIRVVGLLVLVLAVPVALTVWLRARDDPTRHPLTLLGGLFALGAATGPMVGCVEYAAGWAMYEASPVSLASHVVFWYWTVGCFEELAKLLVVYGLAWRPGRIRAPHDAVVYAGTAALGFSAAENLLFVFTAGDGAVAMAVGRSLVATPGHLAYGVLIGAGMGRAWLWRRRTDGSQWMAVGWGGAVLLHGTYDFLLVRGDAGIGLVLLLLGFELALASLLARWALRRTAIEGFARTRAPDGKLPSGGAE